MTGALRRRAVAVGLALLAAVAATPASALLPAEAPFAAATASAASSGLTMTADARYTVDPAKHRVRVAVSLLAKNHRSDTKTHRYFYDRTFLAVQPATANYKIASGDTHPTVRVERRTSTYTLLRIDFGKKLSAGASRRLTLTFDVVDKGGDPTRTTRIGTTLTSFAAWGFGTEGTPGGSVTIVFPAGFSVEVDSKELRAPVTDAAGTITYATGPLADPLDFFAYFVADRPGAYKETTLNVDLGTESVPVTLRAWPDDPAWTKRVRGLLKRGLPALAADIGLPWTLDGPLIVSEAISRNGGSFAGRYDPATGEIEVAYYANAFVVLREAAHVWFDGRLLADRWTTEGFASYYAIRAAKAIGEKKVKGEALTPALDAVRVPLNAWAEPGVDPPDVEAAEHAAALKLAGLVAERATPAGLTAVWRAIHEQRAAYQPIGSGASLETADAAPDWRGVLDLLEDRTGTSYDDLWRTWVVRPNEASLLDERRTARSRYLDTVDRSDPWLLPRVVRDALRAWQFDQVGELLDGADRALDDRDAVLDAASAAGLTPPSTMEAAFEGQRGIAAASAEADAELATISVYRDAAAVRMDHPDIVSRIGLWDVDPSDALGLAAASFSAGDLQASVEASAFARLVWTTADDVGRNRILAVAGSLAAFLLGLWLTIRILRDRRIGRRRQRQFAVGRS